ncbi:U32 family peptidase [Mycoplasma sp. P36-A1]|uniref:U32 family peptidase n=1 Tax=Mycoplasma sp. P36-A1 TaxID=3252900 RepID=UPI003C2D3DFE
MKTKLLAEFSSLEQALKLIENNIDALVINIKGISLTKQFNLYTNELIIICEKAKEKNVELFVNIDRIYHQSDLIGLKVILKKIKEYGISNIIITDVGVIEYCKHNNLEFNYYNGNSILNTNYATMNYLSLYYQGYILSNEININEIAKILENNNSQNIVQVFGKARTFYSKRKLLTSYFEYTEQEEIDFSKNNKIIFDEESEKDNRTYVYEDDFGTYAYTYYNLDETSYLKKLQDLNLQYAYINNMFIEDSNYEKIVIAFNNYFKDKVTLERLQKVIKENANNLSTSFFEDKTVYTIEEAKLLERGL